MARKQGSHAGITGPKLQEVAVRLIARHGYAAVSMRQIAAEVGVQAGALYNYTPDKQSLLFDLMQTHMLGLLHALDAVGLDGDPMQRLAQFTRFHIRFHLPRTDHVFISYMELRNLTPDNFAQIEGLRRKYEDALEAILCQGVEAGAFSVVDTRVTTMALIAMLTGINNWYRIDGRLDMTQIEALYWDMVHRCVGG